MVEVIDDARDLENGMGHPAPLRSYTHTLAIVFGAAFAIGFIWSLLGGTD